MYSFVYKCVMFSCFFVLILLYCSISKTNGNKYILETKIIKLCLIGTMVNSIIIVVKLVEILPSRG